MRDRDPWLEVEEGDGLDRVVVHLSRARRDWFWSGAVVVVWLIWTAGTVLVTIAAWRSPDAVTIIAALGGWLGVLLFTTAIRQMRGRELIEISGRGITVRREPRGPSRAWICPPERLERVSFEYFDSGGGDAETVASVNIVRRGGNIFTRRCLVAAAIGFDQRLEVYETLSRLLAKRDLRCEHRAM